MPSTVRLTIKSKHTIQYLNIPSALISMPYYESLPIPVPPKSYSRARNWTQPEPSNDTFTDDEECSADLAHRESHLVIRIKWSLRNLELPKGPSFVNAVNCKYILQRSTTHYIEWDWFCSCINLTYCMQSIAATGLTTSSLQSTALNVCSFCRALSFFVMLCILIYIL